MSRIVLVNERKRVRFNVEADDGTVVFKGSMCAKKDDAERRAKSIMGYGDELPEHLQIMKGPDGKFAVRGEDHRSREGEKGRIGDAVPLGFGAEQFETEAEAEELRQKIIRALDGAEYADETA